MKYATSGSKRHKRNREFTRSGILFSTGNQIGLRVTTAQLANYPLPLCPNHKGASTMISPRHQSLHEWQRSPMQGAISTVPSNEDHIEIVTDALLDALDRLTFAHHLLESTGISKTHTRLFTAVCDGLNATNEAIERCADSPDESALTIADLEALNPFGE